MERIAIIDCGTNTFHLLIAEMGDTPITLVKKTNLVKIGEGGINKGFITSQGMSRALSAIQEFKSIIEDYSVDNIYAFATSAFRNAKNGTSLKDLIKKETGIQINIITGEQEAELIFKGVSSAVKSSESALVMDIGGGSVEFILSKNEKILWKRSFEIGAQRLLDLFHTDDPISKEEILNLNHYLKKELGALINTLHDINPSLLIGSSGTFDTLSAMYCESYGIKNSSNAPEMPFDIQAFKSIHNTLITKNREERMQIPGMIEMRVDMIVVASCLISFILNQHQFDAIRVSTYALKEGVLEQITKGSLNI